MTKFKVQSRATSCDWTNDGQYFAVGHFSGLVSIRDKVSQCIYPDITVSHLRVATLLDWSLFSCLSVGGGEGED